MPDSGDGNDLLRGDHPVNDPIGTEDDFADVLVVILRNDTTDQREVREHIHFGHEPQAKRFGNRRIVSRDKRHYFLQIIARLKRPDYLVSRVASWRFTSSWGTVSPRSI
jgi:hypothetical protein